MANNKKGGFPMMRIDLSGRFQELLQLNVKHDFFNSGDFSKGKIVLRPTEATIHALGKNSIQYRSTPSGFSLGYAFTDVFTPLKEISEAVHLSFFIELNDIKFYNYTDLPFVFEQDKMFYFNNRSLEKETTENKNLSIGEYVTDEDKIEICSSMISYSFEDEQYGTEVQVVNAAEQIVFEKFLEDGSISCEISLLGQPEGKYTLLVDGLEEKSFFLYNGMKPVFGAIDLFIDKNDYSEYSFFESNGDIIKQDYKIHFGAKAVRWQYLLIETGAEQMHQDHEAYDSRGKDGQAVQFDAAEEATLESGKIIHVIWTTDKILFKEQQKQKFKLKTKRGKSGVEWIVELPCATALGNLKVNLLDKSEVYSELIVYL